MIDIYDLTNFNNADEPLYVIDFNEKKTMQYTVPNKIYGGTKTYCRLSDKDDGIMTIVFADIDDSMIQLYTLEQIENSKRCNIFVESDIPININPYKYYINTKINDNTIMKVYQINYKYDTAVTCNPLYDMALKNGSVFKLLDFKFIGGDIKHVATYMIDVISVTNSIPNKRIQYIRDYMHKEKDSITCFKIFKLNNESYRFYVNYIIKNETKVYFNKFSRDNKFIKRIPIEDITVLFDNIEVIYINNFKWGINMEMDFGRYDVCFYWNVIV